MAGKEERIAKAALEIVGRERDGIRFKDLQRAILTAYPEFNPNTVAGTVVNLPSKYPDLVYKPAPGVYRAIRFVEGDSNQCDRADTPKEEAFYKPFAEWLVDEVEDCTKAIPLGGNVFGDKWGTPDVIGKRESRKSDIIEAPIEIVSAEIKTESGQLVTAFGQACAYCLFSHKSYLVVPKQSALEEVNRLDSLCQVFGIGLVLFDRRNADDPDFQIRVRPRYQQPDLFYANRYLKKIERQLF